MFTTLLVPLNGTQDSAAAVPLVVTLARCWHATVHLVEAVPPGHLDTPAAAAARAYLGEVATGMEKAGVRVVTTVTAGVYAPAILLEAERVEADLIVLSTHGRAGLARAVFGSVADEILHRSPVPVLMLRPGQQPIDQLATLLVPVDGTPGSAVALAIGQAIAATAPARLVLVQAIPETLDRAGQARRGAQIFLDLLVRGLASSGITASAHAVVGEVAETIRTAAKTEHADLIVMSTHALTGPACALLGSIADEIVRTAAQPVLLVRPAYVAYVEGLPTQAASAPARRES
jgi:nucleotide-binding universal stress UspA family protein